MNKKRIIAILVVLTTILFILFGCFIYRDHKESVFNENLNQFLKYSYKTYTLSEHMGKGISSAWYNYIFDDEQYFDKSSGEFYKSYSGPSDKIYCSDFNEAIAVLQLYYQEQGFPDQVDKFFSKAKLYLKNMSDCPDKYKDVYSSAKKLLATLSSIKDCALSPEGSLKDYSSNLHDLFSSFKQGINDIEVEMPDLDFDESKIAN